MKKRLFSILLTVITLIGLMAIPSFAAGVDVWDGTSDTSWYSADTDVFTINTAEQLAGFGKLVDDGNTFEGKTVKLANDLNLLCLDGNGDKVSFNPIGYGYDIVFKGTFDGQGNTISNLYQNGWALGLDYSTEGGGLFASVVDATIKNLNIEKAEVVMECIDMGILVGYSYGNCTYENIKITNSLIANYQRYTGGVVGEVNGVQSFKNVDVDKNTVISSLWGDFDCSLGGIVGGKYGDATLTFLDCDVACEINAYNDVTSSYRWYAYRRAGMLIGNTEESETLEGRTSATASYLTAENCTVKYGDWVNYTYCEFAGTSWPYVRVQEGYSNSAYSNPRYGHPKDANDNEVVDDNHVHNEGEDHFILCAFDQLFGGGQGVYGTSSHDGVTVYYPGDLEEEPDNAIVPIMIMNNSTKQNNSSYSVNATTTLGGTISPRGIKKVKYGKNITYTVSVNSGYEISDILLDGKSIGTNRKFTIKNVKENHTVKVVFSKITSEIPFTDVSESDWFYEDVKFVNEKGLMIGTNEEGTAFSPNKIVSREMLVTILWRLEGSPIVNSDMIFDDVVSGDWYYDAVNWASSCGIVNGVGDGKFQPMNSLTHEQSMAILNRYASYKNLYKNPNGEARNSFVNSEWSESIVSWAENNGIFDSIGSDIYDLTEETNRAELAAYLRRFYINIIE